jgi:hypothetical protein
VQTARWRRLGGSEHGWGRHARMLPHVPHSWGATLLPGGRAPERWRTGQWWEELGWPVRCMGGEAAARLDLEGEEQQQL